MSLTQMNEPSAQPFKTGILAFDSNHLLQSIKWAILPLTSAVSISIILDQFVTAQVEGILRSSEGPTAFVWAWLTISISFSVFFPATFTLISCYFITENHKTAHRPYSFIEFFKRNFEMVVLEGMRAIAYIFFWFFALILPAFYKFASYSLTPFVVIYSQDYGQGKLDALRESQRIGMQKKTRLVLLLMGLYILLPIVSTILFDEYKVFANRPGSAFALSIVDALGIFLFHFFVLRIFKSDFFNEGVIHASDVQLAKD